MVGFRVRVAVQIAALTAILSATTELAAWERFHADGANRGFADVVTKPAGSGSRSVPNLGTFAPGAGPVVAPDGTVYLGTMEGKLIALHADGSAFWSRDINPGEAIIASPAVGADGSVYVIGTKTIRDHRVDAQEKTVSRSTLHKFTSSGGWIAQTPFPEHPGSRGSSAPPNIVRIGGVEIVLAPAVYFSRVSTATDVHLVGFATAGGVLIDQLVSRETAVATGGSGLSTLGAIGCLVPVVGQISCLICGEPFGCDYDPQRVDNSPPAPMPGIAIFTFAGGGAPFVIVSDQRHDVVGYTVSSPAAPKLTETFRVHDPKRQLLSPPMVLPDGHTLVSTVAGEIVFAGPNGSKLPPLKLAGGLVYGAPTLTAGGLAASVAGSKLVLLRDGNVVSTASLPAPSFAAAASSRTHVFVSTTDALVTFDADAKRRLQTFDWVGGGTSPPAIGPKGRVYAIASNILFVFPPPLQIADRPTRGTIEKTR
ncbi:MAG: hypothetical protein ABI981_02320 [Betaproteobacteria bacterium]